MSNRIEKLTEFTYQIPTSYKAGMRVPGIVYADEELFRTAQNDKAIEQVANVAFLPGIVKASFAMPDIHWGYGFPIGGVAATRTEDGVISPGGVGFDINCGVRLVRTDLLAKEVTPHLEPLLRELARNIPKGVGSRGWIRLNRNQLADVMVKGAAWAVAAGYGRPQDLLVIEEGGTMPHADPSKVSQRAFERGLDQPGTLGAGNHFLEIQEVVEVFEPGTAEAFGMFKGQLAVMIHSGSRGIGHQICSDYIKVMDRVVRERGIQLPDRQLGCAPVESPEGKDYFGAMACAVNYAFTNRQCLMHWTRQSFEYHFKKSSESLGMELIYDVCHNIAKLEEHEVDGERRTLCVHRKGATRAFGPGRSDIPEKYRALGQPVIIPGDMGTASYLLVGTEQAMRETWGSTCHGAGRVMSRSEAKRKIPGRELQKDLAARGILVIAGNVGLLGEEAPAAYKDVTRVVDVCHRAGLSRKVARLKPLGVLKG